MANELQHHAALQQIHGVSLIFSGLYSTRNTRNDGLRNLIDGIMGDGGSWNPVFSSFNVRSTYHDPSLLVHKRGSVHDDVILGIRMSRIFMKGLVSAVSLTAEAPLERVKILLQNQQELIKCGRLSRPYRGILDCSVRIIKTEGVFSLWRGNSVNLIRIFPEQALKVLYGYVVDRVSGVDSRKNTVGQETCLTTLVAYIFLYTCLYPLKYARTRLASDIKSVKSGGERQFNGLFDVYRKTLKSVGFVGIYRGFFIGSIGIILDAVYNLAGRGSPPKFERSKRQKLWDDAALLFSLFVAYPFETVQGRMMMTCGEALKYKNSAHALVQIIKNEGILSLYKGFGAYLLGVIPWYLVMTGHKRLQNRPFETISVVIETK